MLLLFLNSTPIIYPGVMLAPAPHPPRATNVLTVPASEETRLRVFALRRPKPPGYVLVNTTSRSTSEVWRGLSPFLLGPVEVQTPRGAFMAANVENAWQYSKVYRVGPTGAPFVDTAGAPTDAYYAWARAGWANPRPVRFPIGRGARPLYSLGPNGERLSYIEARRVLYAPWYAGAVERSAAFAALRALYETGACIGLVDFDGWDHVGQNYSLLAVLNAAKPKMGHAFVLAGLLTGERFWQRGAVLPPPVVNPILIPDDDPVWEQLRL